MTDAEFLRAFEECTIASEQWKHRAHLRVAYLYLRRFPLPQALDKIRAGIKRYNAATNTPEQLDRGYHETITQAWVRLVDAAMRQYGAGENSQDFLEQNPQLTQKHVLQFYYSRDRIFSWRAKGEFVEPDLVELP